MKIFLGLLVAVFAVGFSVFALRDDGFSASAPIADAKAGDESTMYDDADSLWQSGPHFDLQQTPDEFLAIQPEPRTPPDVGNESRFLDADLVIWEFHEDDGVQLNIGDDLDVDELMTQGTIPTASPESSRLVSLSTWKLGRRLRGNEGRSRPCASTPSRIYRARDGCFRAMSRPRSTTY